MVTAEKLGADVGVQHACRALGISRASFYRRRRQKEAPTIERPRAPSPRALSAEQREQVRDTLNSERFMDQAPREVYATLLDEGEYLCSIRTMYRVLNENKAVRERRNQLRHPNYKKPELLASGPNQVWSWDITKLLTAAKMDLLLPVRDFGHLQPLRDRLDAGPLRERRSGIAIDPRNG